MPHSAAVPRLSPLLLVVLAAPAFAADLPVPAKPEYNRDVRPILADACFRCHGFDKAKREADRRLDTRAGALAENDGIRAIVPGDLKASDLHERIHSQDKDEAMPPPKAHRQLTARERAILDRWIEQGAEYQDHWAYLPPLKMQPPAIEEKDFTQNPIDRFILARQQQLGLKHAPEADPATLCRRLHLDLIGLPPTPDELSAFLAESIRSPQSAIRNLTERLLASPHFGERMALPWLDLVRYADSIGYHSDNPRNVWPYRDYVIAAFKANMPFDRFTIEQLAGDLLPAATLDQKIASGFNRLNMTTEEGGAQAKQYEAKTVTDRVKAIGTAWLGQTYMCAECHDHKYDPVTARDFYALGAFFADIKESAIGRREEGKAVAMPEQETRAKVLADALASLQARLDAPSPDLDAAQREWERGLATSAQDVVWTPLQPVQSSADKGSQFIVRPDSTIKVEVAGNPAADTYRITLKPPAGTTGIRLEALPSESLPAKGPGRGANGNFVLGEFGVERDGRAIKLSGASATFEQPGYAAKEAIDGIADKQDNGWAVMGNAGKEAAAYFELEAPLAGDAPVTVVLQQHYGTNHTLGKFRLSATTAPKPIRAPGTQLPADITSILKVAPAQRTPEQAKKLAAHFRGIAPQLEPLRKQLAEAQKARADFEKTLPRMLVSEHTDQMRTVRILPRGDWMRDDGEAVQPALPHYLPQPQVAGRKLTRLDLGQWLVSRENPLTARVFVNRLWKQFFGTGLSKTLEDLGTQGEIPPNQALLDWLAIEFMDSGWDVKKTVRLMVTSGAYRQSSVAPKPLAERDPENRELARQSRFRLDAELVRDNALAISGLLVPKIGGPSAMPYQPAGYWENLNFPTREWEADKDANQWRRGLYTWWQRSYLHPSLAAFDAPSREECTASRTRSNIPQQALALLNDPTYVEAARAFAARILREGGATPEARIAWAWQRATARVPRPAEVATQRALLDKHLGVYSADPKAAAELVKVGLAPAAEGATIPELAAWTSVARAILNLHETITRL